MIVVMCHNAAFIDIMCVMFKQGHAEKQPVWMHITRPV